MARLTGRFGTLHLKTVSPGASIRVMDLFDWTLEYTIEAPQCPIKGEMANTVAVGGIDVRITAQRFFDSGAAMNATSLSKLAVDQMSITPAGTVPGTSVAYVLQQINAVADNACITGEGVVVRGGLNAPRGLTNDTFEMVGITVPVITDSVVLADSVGP